MKCMLINIPRTFDGNNGIHYAICYVLSKGEVNNSSLLTRAKQLSKSVGAADPSGRPRTDYEKLCRALAGVISEDICSTAIGKYADAMKLDVSIHRKPFLSPQDQIDLTVSGENWSSDIEVRSSGHFKQKLTEIYNQDFSVIGWYVTYAKEAERKKDFYVTVLFPFLIDKIFDQEQVRACIAGGATRQMLEEVGTTRHLKQEGATYRTIYPIAKAFDGPEIISKIVSATCDINVWRGLQDASY